MQLPFYLHAIEPLRAFTQAPQPLQAQSMSGIYETFKPLIQRSKALLRRALVWPRPRKALLVMAMDIAICVATVFLAFSLRVGALAFPLTPPLIFAAVAVPVFVPIFYTAGIYSSISRFAGARTIFQLAKATLIYAVPIAVIFLLFSIPDIPRTVALIQPMMFFGMMATMRIAIRYILTDVVLADEFGGRIRRVLIYGAGGAGQQLALALRHEPSTLLAGFIDDDVRLQGQRLNEVRVFHNSELGEVVKDRRVDSVLLAMPNISRRRRAEIVEELQPHRLLVMTLPAMGELVGGNVSISDLKEIQIEDLLGRDTVPPNEILLGRTIVGKDVLVTGAGGSIGSELCRQIVQIGARRLVLFEMTEFSLYAIERELTALAAEHGKKVELVPVLGSVTDREAVQAAFDRYRPETVFHAAAYKHVPLVEANPLEGVRNNILGTKRILEAVEQFGTRDFILVSTDKAVRPTNVMGATKRAAEQLVQEQASRSDGTRYSMVRFGNVLGSSGSVVPLFRAQIEKGGPITLTHREVTRFFMTIPEAALLVIQAAGMARGGEVFVLDMGQPVRIYDLAESMIQLSGLSVAGPDHPDGDIEIVEVGLRPGEKLYEELLIGDDPQPTDHPRIMKAHEDFQSRKKLDGYLAVIEASRDPGKVIETLETMVPEFDHNRDVAGNDNAA